jgi:hypothetical protein
MGLVLPAALLVANMARLWTFTVDDAYISFRYARNFARGLGLVYNPGERVEGYTNFLWTVLLGLGIRVELDPESLAKVLGGAAACGSLAMVYLLSNRLRPYAFAPCVATWLMASSIVQAGYAVFGLETALFTFLVLAGLELFFRERARGSGFPFSGLVFALAGLTRPEAPMYIGIPMLLLGRRFFERQNLLRGALFAGPILAHMVWRYSYYGSWLPNTLAAKTGSLWQQLAGGKSYLLAYAEHTWIVLPLVALGGCVALAEAWNRFPTEAGTWPRLRQLLGSDVAALASLSVAIAGYVAVVGGDWMPFFRFLAPFEPLYFVFACVGLRWFSDPLLAALRSGPVGTKRWLRPSLVGAVVFAIALTGARAQRLVAAEAHMLDDEKVFWDSAAGGAADWLLIEGTPGEIAVADIGYIGYATDYPLLDLLGLVDPVISKLPGGYTNKTGPGYVERVFDRMPAYFVLVGGPRTCGRMAFPAQERLRADPRFQASYRLAGHVLHSKAGYWCIFKRADHSLRQARR